MKLIEQLPIALLAISVAACAAEEDPEISSAQEELSWICDYISGASCQVCQGWASYYGCSPDTCESACNGPSECELALAETTTCLECRELESATAACSGGTVDYCRAAQTCRPAELEAANVGRALADLDARTITLNFEITNVGDPLTTDTAGPSVARIGLHKVTYYHPNSCVGWACDDYDFDVPNREEIQQQAWVNPITSVDVAVPSIPAGETVTVSRAFEITPDMETVHHARLTVDVLNQVAERCEMSVGFCREHGASQYPDIVFGTNHKLRLGTTLVDTDANTLSFPFGLEASNHELPSEPTRVDFYLRPKGGGPDTFVCSYHTERYNFSPGYTSATDDYEPKYANTYVPCQIPASLPPAVDNVYMPWATVDADNLADEANELDNVHDARLITIP